MGLARTNSPLGKLIIRQIGDVGGPRSDLVDAELDNIIAWAKVSPRNIKRDTSTVGNVGGGLDTLHTFSLPANSLQADGDYLKVRYGGKFASNANTKRIVASFGGTAVSSLGTGLFDIRSGDWVYDLYIIRLSSTSVRVSGQIMWTFIARDGAGTMTGNGFYGSINTDITGLSALGSNATTMKVEAEGTANDDIQQNFTVIELTQQ